MNENTLNLVSAIINKDATDIESSFNAAMAEKIAVRLDDMHAVVAQSMFAESEELDLISEEEYLNLSEEEKAQYEILDEASQKSLGKRAAQLSYHYSTGPRGSDSGASNKEVAVSKKAVRKLGKSIAASHGKDTAKRAHDAADDDYGSQYSSMPTTDHKKKVFIKKDLGGKKSKEYKTYKHHLDKSGMGDEDY